MSDADESVAAVRRGVVMFGMGSLFVRVFMLSVVTWAIWWALKPSVSYAKGVGPVSDYCARPWLPFVWLKLQTETTACPATLLPHWLIPLLGAFVALLV